MRTTSFLLTLCLASSLCGQSFLVPAGTSPAAGTCNSFPFNTTDMRYQALVKAADLGNTPALITGFGLAPCNSGVRTMAAITAKMAHFNGGVMTTTFDSNLNSPGPALTVLDSVNYQWHMTSGAWTPIGLQDPFPYNGVDDLVVEFLVIGSSGSSGTTHRESTHQRVYQGSYTGQLTGTSSLTSAFKMRIYTGDASVATFGAGCLGTAGTPAFSFGGTAQIGSTLTLDVTSAPASAPVFLLVGTNSRLPAFPLDLTPQGAVGCTLYHDLGLVMPISADPTGAASSSLPLPNVAGLVGIVVYGSALVYDPGANAANLTATNYGRAMLGN